MARQKSTKPTGAELRAMRDLKGQPTTGPVLEASRRAQAIRDGLDRLPSLTDAIIEAFRQDDWKTLGYASFTAYTLAEFGEERLNLTPAQRSVLVIAFVEAGMSKRAVAAAIGVDESTVRQDLKGAGNPAGPMATRGKGAQVSGPTENADDHKQVGDSAPRPTDPDGPDGPPEGPSTQTAAGRSQVHDDPADGVEGAEHPPVDTPAPAGGVEQSPPAGVTPQDPPVAETSASASTGSARTGRNEADAPQQPGPNTSPDDAEPSNPPEDSGDRYSTDEGDRSGEAANPPAASPDLVHTGHPAATPGEAPTGSEVLSSAGVPSDVGEASGDETAEAGLLPPGLASAVDQPIASPDELKKLIDEWLDVLDRRVEYAVLAPQYDEDTLLDLELQVEGFARMVGLMRRWFEEETAST